MKDNSKIRIIEQLVALWKSGELSSESLAYAVEQALKH